MRNFFVKSGGTINNYWALNSSSKIISRVMLFFAVQIARKLKNVSYTFAHKYQHIKNEYIKII
jgi:hypothetical protein